MPHYDKFPYELGAYDVVNPDLCESGYGSDPGYSMWLRNYMPLMYESWYPDMEDTYFHERRCFLHGDDCIPFPPL